MSTVRDLLAMKGSHVLSVGPDASALDAAYLMNEHRVGALVVLDGGKLAGIITERDFLRKVVGERRDPAETPVHAVMSREVVCCQAHTSLDEARTVLKNRRFRHLPVVDECEALVGIISIGDLNAHQTHEQEHTICILQDYIAGRA